MPRDSNGNANIARNIAVTGQNVRAEQVNVPFGDTQSMLNLVLWRDGISPWTGNQNANGFRITGLPDAANPQDPVTFAQFKIAIDQADPTGKVGEFFRKSAPSGWVPANGGTIGNALSGATTRASEDTEELFKMFWSDFGDDLLPIYTNSGSISTRGSSASADFAAGKRLSIFNESNIFRRGSPSTEDIGKYLPDQIKEHDHTGQTLLAGLHQHRIGSAFVSSGGASSTYPVFGNIPDQFTTFDGEHSHILNINKTGGAENIPKTRNVLVCIKL